jgi:tetratricopeptide (TPR) repeat protein
VYTADDLRSDIRQAELFVANIRPGTSAEELLSFFQQLDALSTGYAQLEQKGVDLRPEQTRLETVQRILADKDRIVVRAMASRTGRVRGGLALQRARFNPPEDHSWWYLDRRVAQRRARRLKRLAWGSLIGAAVLAILVVLYVRFLRPDEATRQRYEYTFSGESSIQQGDYDAALEAYTKALEIAPDDPEINMMVGVMHEALGQPDEARSPYQRAEEVYGSRALFLAMRAQQYTILGWYEQAEADAQEAIKLDDQFPIAYCSLGSALDGQEKVPQAIVAFQTCADLAREQDQNELYVIATTRLAYLMQRP